MALEGDRKLSGLSEEIRRGREQLKSTNRIDLNMRLSPKERESLERVSIANDLSDFDSYGPIRADLTGKLIEHLSQMGANESADIKHVAAAITRISREVVKGFGKEAAWITVRVSTPNDLFDTPRWHSDGAYFETAEGERVFKVVATLKGPSTIFWQSKREQKNITPDSTPPGYATAFLVGHKDAPIHSEPPITESRIFVSILPGSEWEIREWQMSGGE